MVDESRAWENCDIDDLWIFDKLILSKKLGYICGPKGVNVPKPRKYMIKPCVNIMGMGEGAYCEKLSGNTDHIETGTFWCEFFKGRHLSVDYLDGKQLLCVEGFKSTNTFERWDMWKKVEDNISLPNLLIPLAKKYRYMNVEYIGGKIIEVHLRHNPDFHGHNSDIVIPVWEDQQIKPPENMKFIKNKDGKRKGFYINETIS